VLRVPRRPLAAEVGPVNGAFHSELLFGVISSRSLGWTVTARKPRTTKRDP
jgi:hypothetical protein